jgi:hypothetical protein
MSPLLQREKFHSRPRERGSAFIMAIFAVLIALTGAITVLEWGATLRRRDKEAEMIWRGHQYERAIRLYFHKTGHYPQTIDDLKKGLPQLHFLRQAYKDPINTKEDGAWRFIYVNGAGQIIGSTRYASLQQMAMLETGQLLPGQQAAIPGQPGIPVSSLANPGSASSGQTSSTGGSTGSTSPSGQNPPPDQSGQNPQNPPSDQSGQNPQAPQNPPAQPPSGPGGTSIFGQPGQLGQPSNAPGTFGNPAGLQKPTGPVDGPVLGAFLTGVASKDKRPSLKVYHGGKKYEDWEFIWNPLVDAAAAAQQALSPGGALPGMPGLPIANPFGGSTFGPGPGTNPNSPNMPQPGPNPSPQPQQPQQ